MNKPEFKPAALKGDQPTPFLPKTHVQFAWDSTSLELFKRCPRLYQYTMIDGWTTASEGIHLRFGIEYHQGLHDYETFKALGEGDHEDWLRETIKTLLIRIADWSPDPNTDSEKLKSKYNLVRSIIWYLDQFKKDPAETVILDNGKPALEVSFRFELDWGPELDGKVGQPYLLCGHLDRVVSYNGDYYVMDRKTTSTTPSSYFFDQFDPHNQMTLYTLASKVIFDTPVKGVIIDAMQIAVGFSRPVRSFTYRTADQLQEWMNDLHFWFALAEDYAAEEYWPMNDTACDKYGGCRFRQICRKSPSVREQFLKTHFVKQALEDRWNPIKVRI